MRERCSIIRCRIVGEFPQTDRLYEIDDRHWVIWVGNYPEPVVDDGFDDPKRGGPASTRIGQQDPI